MRTRVRLMKLQIENRPQVPLLSFRDARILVILYIFGTKEDIKVRLEQMEKRHQKRQYDINLKYKQQTKNQLNLTS